MTQKQNKSQSRKWLIVCYVATALPIIGYLFIDFMFGGKLATISTYAQAARWLLFAGVIALIVLIVSMFKLRGRTRLIPITGGLLTAGIIFLAYFIQWFSGYQF
jgi:hypothetical protein